MQQTKIVDLYQETGMGESRHQSKGLCKENKIQKIRDYYGSGWEGPGLSDFFVENRPKIALNQY